MVLRFCSQAGPSEVERVRRELRTDKELFESLRTQAAAEALRQSPGPLAERVARLATLFADGRLTASAVGQEILECVYACTRLRTPDVMIETGTFDGRQAAVIARALQRNGKGRLISVDLPAYQPIVHAVGVSLPPGRASGWLIPALVKPWCEVRLGDSREVLPNVFAEHPAIEMFLHDSLHTEAHMRFEYETAWAHVVPGGVLLSDDVFLTPAFHRFCRAVGQPYVHIGTFGGVRKPG